MYVCMSVCLCVCLSVCMYVCMHACMYVCGVSYLWAGSCVSKLLRFLRVPPGSDGLVSTCYQSDRVHHTSADQRNVLHSFERNRKFCKLFLHALWLVIIPSTAPRLPRKQPRRHGRHVPRLPREMKVDVTKYHACPANRGVTGDKSGPSAPPNAISATPATQNAGGCEFVPRLPRGHPPSFLVAGVAQIHIHGRFAWQARHSWYWVARLVRICRLWRRGTLRGRRGIW